MSELNIEGKNAIITGASRGIGKAIALKLAQEEVNIVLAARNPAVLDRAVKEIQSHAKGKVMGVPTDISRLADLQKLYAVTLRELGGVDILINNAAQTVRRPPGFYSHLIENERLDIASLLHCVEDKMMFKGISFDKIRNEFLKKELRLKKLWEKRLSQQMASLPEYDDIFRVVKRAFRQAEFLP